MEKAHRISDVRLQVYSQCEILNDILEGIYHDNEEDSNAAILAMKIDGVLASLYKIAEK